RGDEVAQLLAAIVAEIIEPVRCAAFASAFAQVGFGGQTRPGCEGGLVLRSALARRRTVESRQYAGGDVVDVGEVAAHVAAVEDRDRLAGQDRAREDESRHVGPAPGPVDGE